MQITIFGASGRVGQLAVNIALGEGYSVVAFVHSHNPFSESEHLRVVKGDTGNASDVRQALKGSTAVISTLGSWGRKDKNVLTTAMQVIIPAMEESGMRRLITLTGSDALMVSEKSSLIRKLSRGLFGLLARDVLLDGEAHLRVLASSTLDWTTIRSPVMNNRGSKQYRLTRAWLLPIHTINRSAVAQALMDEIKHVDFVGHAPFIYRGS